jgi:hypothetical protein
MREKREEKKKKMSKHVLNHHDGVAMTLLSPPMIVTIRHWSKSHTSPKHNDFLHTLVLAMHMSSSLPLLVDLNPCNSYRF